MFFPHRPLSENEHRNVLVGLVGVGVLLLVAAVLTSPWALIGIALLIAAVYASWREPMWTVMFLAAWWPIEPFILKFVNDDVYIFARYASESLIYVLVAVVIIGIISGRYHRRSTPVDAPFVLFLFIILVSTILNTLPVTDAILGARQIIRFMLLFFVVVYRYPRRFWMRRVIAILIATLLIQSTIGIAQTISGGALDSFLLPSERRTYSDIQLTEGTVQFWDPGQRVFGTFGRYDRMGTFLALVLLIIIAITYESETKPEWRLWGLAALIGVPALILTYSRSSWFGLILGGLAIAWVRKDKRVLVGAFVIGLVMAGMLGFSGIQKTLADVPRQTVVERLFEAFSYQRFRGEYFGLGRVFWIAHTPTTVVPHSLVSGLFGWGPASYGGGAVAALGNTRVYDTVGLPFGVYGTEGYIDNNWMSLWGETGTLGIIFYAWLYLAMMLLAIKVARHSRTPLGRAIGVAYVGIAVEVWVNAFLATFLEIRTLAPYLWILAGFVVVIGSREKLIATRYR